MDTKLSENIPSPKAEIFAGISMLSGLGAITAKSCCILPFLLASSGIGSAWLTQELVILRHFFLAAAILSLVMGWILVIRRNRVACQTEGPCAVSRASWLTFTMLSLATVLIGFAFLWSFLQPVIFEYLKNAT